MQLQHPFEPIVDHDSKVLILGSFPSIVSFENNFYYAHPRNAFWPIIEALFNVTLPSIALREEFLHIKHIALWDAFASLRRDQGNSSDANLTDTLINPIDVFVQNHLDIKHVLCNGTTSYKAIMQHFKSLHVKVHKLPSTSPAYAAMRFEQKLERWHILKELLETP